MNKKYGLVLAGGGAKGAYQLGAWKAMRELGITFEAVTGVSVGSINGALIASDSFEAANELWHSASVDKGVNITEELRDPDKLFSIKNIPALFKEFIKNGGIDASPTREFLSHYIDEEKVRNSEIKFGLVSFILSEFSPLEVFVDKIPEGELIDYILASSKVPGVTKIGPDGEKYLDGGAYDNVPVGLMRKNGYNRIIVIDISNIKGIGHKLDFTCSEFIYIRPYDPDDLGAAFDFSEEMIEKRMRMGYLDTKKAFGLLSGRRFYFDGNDFRGLVEKFGSEACEQLERLGVHLGADKLKIYSPNEFVLELKKKYEEYKEEQSLRNQELEQKFYGQIIKKIPIPNIEKEFPEAVAVLENFII